MTREEIRGRKGNGVVQRQIRGKLKIQTMDILFDSLLKYPLWGETRWKTDHTSVGSRRNQKFGPGYINSIRPECFPP